MSVDDLDQLEKRVISLETRGAVDEVHRKNVADRLGAIEDTLKWLVRLMIGGLIVAGLTYALNGGFSMP